MHGFTHRQVEAFRAVMICGSMTDAARMLSVTQPAVSKILRQMEAELGFALFRRDGGLKPTEAAELLFEEVKRAYSGLDHIAWTAAQIRSRTSGVLRIAVPPAFSGGFIQRVVRKLTDEDDTVRLSILSYNSEEAVDLVASGLCDLGYVMTPVAPSRVLVGEVMTVPSFAILPATHRLAGRERISVRDMQGEHFVSMGEGTASRQRIDALFASHNVERVARIEARWSLAVIGLVGAGLGWAIVEGFSAQAAPAFGCVAIPLAEAADFTFVCVRPRRGRDSALTRRFVEMVEQELRTHVARCNAPIRTMSPAACEAASVPEALADPVGR
ncbi:LysR substrate-binding domain-containing protein [Acuticoccus kandeliae]|uniref:LysR substrate-binding domain-containing protein n=1 Tax=Acuticoccus kandeliae TaxID=2073160 RepID=UPI0014739736|nr:LysR substrate-binding domain-containing protein [Acuticoccus kandeliae]